MIDILYSILTCAPLVALTGALAVIATFIDIALDVETDKENWTYIMSDAFDDILAGCDRETIDRLIDEVSQRDMIVGYKRLTYINVK